ncbi:Tyrosine recombinase XerC [Kluyvera cryocrescens]|uniref:Tyrosine recombinase XerC n=1 Tax=Kluyvera cryocrescens TaxID=580 RepID=A0A485B7I6_KLUCR|nr:Tyrosine recombinase XerC [Kluyvera cryocrescens]
MVSQGELPANPAKGVAAPKAPRHLPKNIDVDDVNRLLDIDLNDPLAVRDSRDAGSDVRGRPAFV